MSELERGLDGWHVCGLDREQLFYSKNPVVRLSDGEYVNIQNASRHDWTQEMGSAHSGVLEFGCARYAQMLAQALHKLVDHTGGAGTQMTNFVAEVPETVEQFGLLVNDSNECLVPGLPPCHTTLLQAVPYSVGIEQAQKSDRYLLPCAGMSDATGQTRGAITGTYSIAGPRYVRARRLQARLGKIEKGRVVPPKSAAQQVFELREERARAGGMEIGPVARDPCTKIVDCEGAHLELHVWQLTPVDRDLCWSRETRRPDPVRSVAWVGEVEAVDDRTGRRQKPINFRGFSATVLLFTLDFPPINLRDVVGPFYPDARAHGPPARVMPFESWLEPGAVLPVPWLNHPAAGPHSSHSSRGPPGPSGPRPAQDGPFLRRTH